MTLEILASGAFGALFVFGLGFLREWWLRSSRITTYRNALRAEIKECGRIANEYPAESVKAPLYRLPTVCYAHSFPGLLGEGNIGENEARALVKFYAEVETLNRGFDLAELMRQARDKDSLIDMANRNRLKAAKIAAPSGGLYAAALAVI